TTSPMPVCQTCDPNLIVKSQTEEWAKPMDGDVTEVKHGCANRTFTCRGTAAMINVFGPNHESLGSIDDGGTGTVTFPVTCNVNDNAWVNS
ncbi:hypothetical protein PMAYCL1PPCAC_21421, partial [Pristionchus mayeri]